MTKMMMTQFKMVANVRTLLEKNGYETMEQTFTADPINHTSSTNTTHGPNVASKAENLLI